MPSISCGAEEARARLPELLERARNGQTTIVTRRGKPYAALVPLEELRRSAGSISLLSLAGTGAGLWGRRPSSAVARMRDEWQ